MADHEDLLKLGKGVAFGKSQLKRLRQKIETWEADFRALPKPIKQDATHSIGLVLTQPERVTSIPQKSSHEALSILKARQFDTIRYPEIKKALRQFRRRAFREKSGGGRTPIELFLAGLGEWGQAIQNLLGPRNVS